MILDSLEQFNRYAGLNPLFPRVAEFLASTDMASLKPGRHDILGDDLYVNIAEAKPKTQAEALIETHDCMIDIQVPITDAEQQGWTPREALPHSTYNPDTDMTLYEGQAQTYFELRPGQFTIFFPSDGHAPAITATTLRKAIFKVKA